MTRRILLFFVLPLAALCAYAHLYYSLTTVRRQLATSQQSLVAATEQQAAWIVTYNQNLAAQKTDLTQLGGQLAALTKTVSSTGLINRAAAESSINLREEMQALAGQLQTMQSNQNLMQASSYNLQKMLKEHDQAIAELRTLGPTEAGAPGMAVPTVIVDGGTIPHPKAGGSRANPGAGPQPGEVGGAQPVPEDSLFKPRK